jgi:type II secretory pathway pseudopilin PulG
MIGNYLPTATSSPARIDYLRCRRRAAQQLRSAFSLVEALVALSITAMAGVVLLLSVESSLQTTSDAVDRTIADGAAQRLLDEILTRRFVELDEADSSGSGSGSGDSGSGSSGSGSGGLLDGLAETLGATVNELLGNGFELFDDIDDFAGHVAQPLKGSHGEVLGTGDDEGGERLVNFRLRSNFFGRWRQRVDVYYVDANDHTIRRTEVTPYRAIEVFVERVETDGTIFPLAHRKRIVAYIPPPES